MKTMLMLMTASLIALGACKKDDKPTEVKDKPAENKAAENKAADTKAAATKADPKADENKPTAVAKPAEGGQPFDLSSILDTPIKTLDGKDSKVGDHKGKALLLVNVASKCGLTPQYATLEKLQKKYGTQGFTVLGFPSNQFGGQEPGSHEEIAEFCSKTYGVTFPMFEKIEVNGEGRHPIYKTLTEVKDAEGKAGDIQWNFEKFVVSADGKTIHRFRPRTKPDSDEVIAAIKAGMPTAAN